MSNKIDDARKEVIDFITKKLENENSVPWRDPCFNRAPINPISGIEYKGFNSMRLACVAMKRNYNDPRWVTFKQAKEKKYHLKKGSKGTTVEYYQYCKGELSDLEKEELKKQGKTDKEIEKMQHTGHFIARSYVVFNASQFSNFPELSNNIDNESVVRKHKELETIIKNSEAPIFYDETELNHYNRKDDEIHLRRKDEFKSANAFYSTAMHEIGHSTGHKSRLNRFSDEMSKLGYAKEELVAELNSVFLNQKYNIGFSQSQLENNTTYIQEWAKYIKDDPKFLFKAISDADKAVKYIEDKMLNKGIDKENEEKNEKMPALSEKKGVMWEGEEVRTEKESKEEKAAKKELIEPIIEDYRKAKEKALSPEKLEMDLNKIRYTMGFLAKNHVITKGDMEKTALPLKNGDMKAFKQLSNAVKKKAQELSAGMER